MNGLIAYKLNDGQYELVANGVGLVLNIEVDKVLPVREHVARQAYKLDYDGESLTLKDGERILSLDELKAEDKAKDELLGNSYDDEQGEIVEVQPSE